MTKKRRLVHVTRVRARLRLANGVTRIYDWTTPVKFGRALSKGGAWAREELRRENVRGRSSIEELQVTVERIGD